MNTQNDYRRYGVYLPIDDVQVPVARQFYTGWLHQKDSWRVVVGNKCSMEKFVASCVEQWRKGMVQVDSSRWSVREYQGKEPVVSLKDFEGNILPEIGF